MPPFCKYFKHILSGGMSTLKRVSDEWKAVTGLTVHKAYGLSEMLPAVTVNRFDDEFNGTVGYYTLCQALMSLSVRIKAMICQQMKMVKSG